MVAPREHPKPLSKSSFDFLLFVQLFCLPLGSLWPPFWLPLAAFGLPMASLLAPFGSLWHLFASHFLECGRKVKSDLALPSLWLPLASLFALFGTLWLPLGSLGPVSAPPQGLIDSGGEISPRSCQDLAEILPRTCRESSNNPPRTRRMNLKQKLPFTLQLLQKAFVRRQTFPQNRLE